tara:strand:+ start:2464 stop:2886 length:423 start_codon:yes stop_codon:yes gene_type:complete
MATTYIIGNDGFVTLSQPVQGLTVKSWAANCTRVSTDITGFDDTARRRRLGLFDMTGSLTGSPMFGTTTSVITVTSLQTANSALVLGLSAGTNSSTGVTFSLTPVYDSFSFTSAKDGEATVAVTFQNASGAVPTVVWSVA